MSRSSCGVTSMAGHAIDGPANRIGPLRKTPESADHAAEDEKAEDQDHERDVEHPDRRDDAPHRRDGPLGEVDHHAVELGWETAGVHREPRQHRPDHEDDDEGCDQPAEDPGHGQPWYSLRAWSRSFSSCETSTFVGVSRNTWSATRAIEPPTA